MSSRAPHKDWELIRVHKAIASKRFTAVLVLALTALLFLFFKPQTSSSFLKKQVTVPDNFTVVIPSGVQGSYQEPGASDFNRVSSPVSQAELSQPQYVAVGPDSLIYVADSGNNQVKAFTLSGELKFSFGQKGNGPGEFDFPDGVAVAPNGDIYVGEIGNQRVQVFTPTGTFLKQFKTQRPFKPGVMVFEGSDLFIADLTHQQIVKYGLDGQLKLAFGEPGSDPGQLAFPSGIYPSESEIFVSDSNNGRIEVFDHTGRFLRKFGDSPSGMDSLTLPVGIVGIGNQLFVVDTFSHKIKVFTKEGKAVYSIGEKGIQERQFNFPEGLAVDSRGILYVADSGNNRIQALSLKALGGR